MTVPVIKFIALLAPSRKTASVVNKQWVKIHRPERREYLLTPVKLIRYSGQAIQVKNIFRVIIQKIHQQGKFWQATD